MFIYYILGIVLIPPIILGIYAEGKVRKTFEAYSSVKTNRGLSAAEVARELLDSYVASDVVIKEVIGNLTDHYDPKNKILALSKTVYGSKSIAAVSVAAHEVGHACQHAEKSVIMSSRNLAARAANISSTLLWPIIIVGFIFGLVYVDGIIGNVFLYAGLIFFGVTFIYSLVTLPLERDASKRAIVMLQNSGNLDESEVASARAVLDAAALTYFASMIASFLSLLRFVPYIIASKK